MLELLELAKRQSNIVFVYGDFNILHPGHIRFLKFAAEQGEYLVVGVNSYASSSSASVPNDVRIEALECLSLVNLVVLLDENLEQVLSQLKPKAMVKGAEWANRINYEANLLKALNIDLVFGSGESTPVGFHTLTEDLSSISREISNKTQAYVERRTININDMISVINQFNTLNVAVIGDLIIDEYVTCEAVGMSQEDPTIVVRPLGNSLFVGGAGIVAAHAAGLGANVDYFTVVGNDELAIQAQEMIRKHNVQFWPFCDKTRPTTIKKRYRAQSKTMLRVNDYRSHHIDLEIANEIIKRFEQQVAKYDLLVFSDFNYGLLSPYLVNKLTEIANQYGLITVADSQSSAQVGDLAKFIGMTLITPTEHEARITLQDNKEGLIELSANLGEKLKSNNTLVTLGKEGVLIRKKSKGNWETEELPALSSNALDVAGAGDAMMISSALAMCADNNIWQAALLGSIASSCQVERVGNIPLTTEEIITRMNEIW